MQQIKKFLAAVAVIAIVVIVVNPSCLVLPACLPACGLVELVGWVGWLRVESFSRKDSLKQPASRTFFYLLLFALFFPFKTTGEGGPKEWLAGFAVFPSLFKLHTAHHPLVQDQSYRTSYQEKRILERSGEMIGLLLFVALRCAVYT